MPSENVQNPAVTPEAEQIARIVREWLNTYPEKPLRKMDVEFLGEDAGLAIATTQAAYKVRQYITGGYQAQYQFAILYQTMPQNTNERLEADELLNNYAVWVITTAREELAARLPENCQYCRLTQNTNAALLGRSENGAEVHQILFTLLYEVNV